MRSDVTSDGYRVAGVCMQRSKGPPVYLLAAGVLIGARHRQRAAPAQAEDGLRCARPPPGCMVRKGAPREWMRADNLAMCAPRNAAGQGNFSRMQCGVKPALIGPPMVVAQRAASVRHPCWPAALRPGPRSC